MNGRLQNIMECMLQSNMGLFTEYTRSNMQGKISGAECVVCDMGGEFKVRMKNNFCIQEFCLYETEYTFAMHTHLVPHNSFYNM